MNNFIETPYNVYVFFCLENTYNLTQRNFWDSVLALTNKMMPNNKYAQEALNVDIFDKLTKSFIEIRNKSWSTESITGFTEGDIFKNSTIEISHVSITLPSLKICFEKKTTPDVLIIIQYKLSTSETRFDYAFLFAIKETNTLNIPLKKEQALFQELLLLSQPVFAVKKRMLWAKQISETQFNQSLQDFFPATMLTNDNTYSLTDRYKDWEVVLQ